MQPGRPKAQYSQGYRLVKIMEMFQARQNVTIPALMEQFGVSRRTIHRDLAALTENYSIEEAGVLSDNRKVWRLSSPRQSEMLKLTVMEMTSLFMGKNLFNFTRGTELKNSIDSLFAKVSHRLASSRKAYRERLERKFYCTPGAPKNYAAHDDALNEIVTSLLNENKLRVRYRKPGQEPSSDTLHPYTLVIHNNALYLIAYSEKAREPHTYAVERIVEASWLKGTLFTYPEDYDPGAFLHSAFGITVGKPVRIMLRVRPEVLTFFEQRLWHESQKIEIKGKHALVHLEVPLTAEFTSWLLSFGDKVEVLEPILLRQQLKSVALGLFSLYSEEETLN